MLHSPGRTCSTGGSGLVARSVDVIGRECQTACTVLPRPVDHDEGEHTHAGSGGQGRGGGGGRVGHRCRDRRPAGRGGRGGGRRRPRRGQRRGGRRRGARRRRAGARGDSSTSPTTTRSARSCAPRCAEFGGLDHLHANAADLSPETIGRDSDAFDVPLEVFDQTLAGEPAAATCCAPATRCRTCWRAAAVRSSTPARRPGTSASPSGRRTRCRRRASTRWCATSRRSGAGRGSGPTRWRRAWS